MHDERFRSWLPSCSLRGPEAWDDAAELAFVEITVVVMSVSIEEKVKALDREVTGDT